jgi:hypothetical protein
MTAATFGLTPERVAQLINTSAAQTAKVAPKSQSRATQAYFTNDEVEDIRIARSLGKSVKRLANEWTAGITTISKITTGQSYKDAPGPIQSPKVRRLYVSEPLKEQIVRAWQQHPKPTMRALCKRFRMDKKRIKSFIANAEKVSERDSKRVQELKSKGKRPSQIAFETGIPLTRIKTIIRANAARLTKPTVRITNNSK